MHEDYLLLQLSSNGVGCSPQVWSQYTCILFVKTIRWFVKRFRYCKERLKERMIYLNIKREEKHFGSIQLLFLEELHAVTQALFLKKLFSFFPVSFFFFTIQCRVYVRIISWRNKKAISSEVSVNTNGIRSIAISSNIYNSCTYLFDPFFYSLLLLFESSFIVVIIVICIIQLMALWVDGWKTSYGAHGIKSYTSWH